MAGAPMEFDRIIPEETQGPMPVQAPSTLAAESLDSFQHVEAVMKEEDVSTVGLDSQDWEMVAEMVEDTENAATNFMQSAHVVDLTGPAPNLQDSIKTMMDTMEKLKLGPLKPPPSPRVWLPLLRQFSVVRLLWMMRCWNRLSTSGRCLDVAQTPKPMSWRMFPFLWKESPRMSRTWWIG